ncbi:hypothetical protein Esti_002240 [Eimeria stiedai]
MTEYCFVWKEDQGRLAFPFAEKAEKESPNDSLLLRGPCLFLTTSHDVDTLASEATGCTSGSRMHATALEHGGSSSSKRATPRRACSPSSMKAHRDGRPVDAEASPCAAAAAAVVVVAATAAAAEEDDVLREEAQEQQAAAAATAFIAAAASGQTASADAVLQWPPQTPLWRDRTAAEVLSAAALQQHQQQMLLPLLWQQQQLLLLPLGEQQLDASLRGGLPSGLLGEVCGAAGSGKTQFVLSLAAETVLQQQLLQQQQKRLLSSSSSNNNNGSSSMGVVYYIHSEGAFPVSRLAEVLLQRLLRRSPSSLSTAAAAGLLQRILVEEISCEEELVSCLLHKLPRLIASRGRVSLLIVDSLAALLKQSSAAAATATAAAAAAAAAGHSAKLVRLASLMRRVATEHSCCCLVINHVSAAIDVTPASAAAGAAAGQRWQQQDVWSSTENSKRRRVDGEQQQQQQQIAPPSAAESTAAATTAAAAAAAAHSIVAAANPPSDIRPALGEVWSSCLHYRIFLSRLSAYSDLRAAAAAAAACVAEQQQREQQHEEGRGEGAERAETDRDS